MAKQSKTTPTPRQPVATQPTDFSSTDMMSDYAADLIKSINKDFGSRVMYNFTTDFEEEEASSYRISTGSVGLDYIISNRLYGKGGYPAGRIIEIQGPTSVGKTHLAYESIKDCQRRGGIAVYLDTEQTSVLENLIQVGINVNKNFIYAQQTRTEVVFALMEAAIIKARSANATAPILVVLDSLAGCIPNYVAENGYDKETIGVQARVLSKCIPKINDILNAHKAILIIINQQREKIGVMMGDPSTTPGGKTVPFFSSVRLRLYGGKPIMKDFNGVEKPIGIEVRCKVIKNKLTLPYRETNFDIHFGKGIVDDEYIFDYLRAWCEKNEAIVNGKLIKVSGTGAWKAFTISNAETGEIEKEVKFYKAEFGETILRNPEHKNAIVALMDKAYVMKPGEYTHATFTGMDTNSLEEIKQENN